MKLLEFDFKDRDGWCITLNLDYKQGRAGRVVALNWFWPRDKGERFGYWETWYDGPHKSFTVGPVNLYWNF